LIKLLHKKIDDRERKREGRRKEGRKGGRAKVQEALGSGVTRSRSSGLVWKALLATNVAFMFISVGSHWRA
jgi:hypothetical protein